MFSLGTYRRFTMEQLPLFTVECYPALLTDEEGKKLFFVFWFDCAGTLFSASLCNEFGLQKLLTWEEYFGLQ